MVRTTVYLFECRYSYTWMGSFVGVRQEKQEQGGWVSVWLACYYYAWDELWWGAGVIGCPQGNDHLKPTKDLLDVVPSDYGMFFKRIIVYDTKKR